MKKIIVVNHRSALKEEEAKKYPLEINDYIRNDQNVIICPSSIYIPYFKGKYNFKVGSQNISDKNITGEITGEILKSAEIKYALVEALDRKQEYEENIKRTNNNIKNALKNGITPIVTIGETYYEKELNKTIPVIKRQIKEYFRDIEIKNDIIICYAPNWEYKGKEIPSEKYIKEVIELIKRIFKNNYNTNIKVIYGGLITKENIKEIDKMIGSDGYILSENISNIDNLRQIFNEIE